MNTNRSFLRQLKEEEACEAAKRETKCNRCGNTRDTIPGETCGKTDSWGEHPCNGMLTLIPPNLGLKKCVGRAINHMVKLQAHYVNDVNQQQFIRLHKDIENLRRHEGKLE
jgi:hypothetical protein